VVGEIFASMACHSVIRAGQSQSFEQMKSLLAQMDEHPLSSFCPHGRPVFVKRTFFDIEREFGRIV
jgi:DNA mismatch repair protein MutL